MTFRDLPARVAKHFRCHEGDPEIAAIFFVDGRYRIIDMHLIEGAPDMLELPVSQILRDSAALQARLLMMIHTHPSGDPHPSTHDVAVTRMLCAHLRRQKQRLIDHIILSKHLYFSFRANRML